MAKTETSLKSESPVLVVERSYPEPEPNVSTVTFCLDKLQCSAFLTGFGEQVAQRSGTDASLGNWSGQELFELLWNTQSLH